MPSHQEMDVSQVPPREKIFRNQRFAALLTTAASGFSGLVYEVTWHKQLSALVGSEARATAIILAVFLGGLAIGYGIFGFLSRRNSASRNIKILGYAELAIGAWALIFDDVFLGVSQVAKNLPLTGPLAVGAEFLIACALIIIPTILMGGTLPLLTQGMSRDLEDAPRFHARVYALNTFGAFVGCLVAGFYLLPRHGLNLTLLMMAFVNIAVGLALIFIALRMKDHIGSTSFVEKNEVRNDDQKSTHLKFSLHRYLPKWRSFSIAWLAGFYGICIQTLLIRLIGLTMGSSEYAFSMIVSLYIGTLALGAHQVGRCPRITWSSLLRNQLGLLLGSFVVFITVPYWGYGNHLIRIIFSTSQMSFYAYFLSCFLFMGALLYLMLWCMGRTLPLLFGVSQLREKDLGKDVGALYGVNTLGCVIGAVLGGYMLFFVLDLDQIFKLSMVSIGITVIMTLPEKLSARQVAYAVVASTVIWFLPDWNREFMGRGLFRTTQETAVSYDGPEKLLKLIFSRTSSLVAYKDGPTGTIAVYETQKPPANNHKDSSDLGVNEKPEKHREIGLSRALFVNGKSDGDVKGDYLTTILLAHLPGLFHQSRTQQAAVIGFGTGVTVGGLTMYPEIKNVDCIEISSSVHAFAKYFAPYNGAAESHPKVSWILADAHRYFMNTAKKYDLIISEPSNPWVTGVEKVFSQEFFASARDLLHEEGIYAQWFHTYSMSGQTFALVLNTFRTVFPHVYTFGFKGDIVLLGRLSELSGSHVALAEERLKKISEIRESLHEANIDSLSDILGLEYWNPPSFYADSGLHTLDFPKLSYEAGKDFYRGSQVNLTSSLNQWPIFPWVLDYANHSLSYLFDVSRNFQSDKEREAHIKSLCGVKNLSDISLNSIHIQPQPCRSLVFRGIKEGLISTSSLPKDHVLHALTEKFAQESWTAERAKKFAEGFVYFNSPLTRIPLEELTLRTAVCYAPEREDMECIYTHAMSLAVAGQPAQSRKVFEKYQGQIQETLGPGWVEKWTAVVTQSERVQKSTQLARSTPIF